MSINSEQIDTWRKLPEETRSIEFKEAKKQYDFEKLCKYCVAIANEGGGHFILGVMDKLPRPVVGTEAFQTPQKTESDLFQHIGFRVDLNEVQHPIGRVLVFVIPSRPKGTAYHYKGQYLMRSGESIVPMSEDQLRQIFAEGKPDWLEEDSVSNISEQEVIDLLDTQTFFELLHLPFPSNHSSILDKLSQENIIKKYDSSYSITRIGAILLARNLDDFPDIKRKTPRVIVYNDDSKFDSRLDQIGKKGYAVGFSGLIDFINGHLPQNEVIKDSLRLTVKLVPEIVIRELVANALIHQDFIESGTSVLIEIYTNRIEISNPGEPIIPVERFIDGYKSRNEKFADIMRRMGICEERSSGIDRVIDTIENYQLPAPDFRSGLQRTIVIVYGHKDFSVMTREERIRACYQHCTLKYVSSGFMTNQSLRERFHLPENKSVNVSQVISHTLEEGLIKSDEKIGGSRKFARYIPIWA